MLSLANAFYEKDLLNFEKRIMNFLSQKKNFQITQNGGGVVREVGQDGGPEASRAVNNPTEEQAEENPWEEAVELEVNEAE